MQRRVKQILFPIALAALAAGCASLKIDSWMDPAFKGRPMGKVMVVGVAESESIQRRYEDMFVAALKETGGQAEASSTHFTPDTRLDEAGLKQKLGDEGMDSLLVTRVIDEKEKAEYYPPVSYPSVYNSYFGYYSHTFDYVHSPGYMTTYLEIHLETNLYDVETGKLVWSGQKKITDDRSDKKNMEQVIKATIRDLQKNGLL